MQPADTRPAERVSEATTIILSLLVFAVFTFTGMIREECARSKVVSMDLPFSGFELTFIVIAFAVFSFFSVISVCIQPQPDEPGDDNNEDKWVQRFKRKQRVITRQLRQEP